MLIKDLRRGKTGVAPLIFLHARRLIDFLRDLVFEHPFLHPADGEQVIK
jgi:hypothetical protein